MILTASKYSLEIFIFCGKIFFGCSSLHQKLEGMFCFLCVMQYRRRKKLIRHWICLELPQYFYISETVTLQTRQFCLEVFVSTFSVSAAAKEAASLSERPQVPECSCDRGGKKISFDWTWTSLKGLNMTPHKLLLAATFLNYNCISMLE